jgi:glycosyl hydrolase family 123
MTLTSTSTGVSSLIPISVLLLAIALPALCLGADDVPYGNPPEPWDEMLGNHRAIVRVAETADAVRVRIPWRRRDTDPEEKSILVYSAADGGRVLNVVRVKVTREAGDLVFQPRGEPGDYYVYYMPLAPRPEGSIVRTAAEYLAPQATADPAWMRRHNLAGEAPSRGKWRQLPEARVIQIQARTPFDSFYPMEVIATQAEVEQLVRQYPDRPYLLFPEDRDHPIKMFDHLPLRWIRSGPDRRLEGKTHRNEFYVFQIGVYAREALARGEPPIAVEFGDLAGPERAVIAAGALKCFNLGGVDDTGRPFRKKWTVAPGHVGALWCGVQVPPDTPSGRYEGRLMVRAEGHEPMPVALALDVATPRDGFLRDGGTDQPGRLARLKWLDSTIGLEETITPPYTPLHVNGSTITCLGRQVHLSEDGFPDSIRAGNVEVLAAPITLKAMRGGSALEWNGSSSRVVSKAHHKVAWESRSPGENLELRVRATMEFDGAMDFDVKLRATGPVSVSDIALEIPYRKEVALYAAGMGLDGGYRPQSWQWSWSEQPQRWREQGSNLEYFVWLGGVEAGLYCRLTSPLRDWKNGTSGGVRIEEQRDDQVMFRAHSGARQLRDGEELDLSFRLLPTPLKSLDPNRWKIRYAHTYRPLTEIKEAAATVVNIHHAQLPNLFINYPFQDLDLLVPYVKEAHRAGLKAKLYYTVRELTTRLPELWAFRSLGTEIYRVGGEQGHGQPHLDSWLQEHLVRDYAPAWIWSVPIGEVDAAIRTHFNSRLNNFYLEGLKWLLENVEIDGLYLDEVGYSRQMLQRVRRVLDGTRPGSLIDLHGNRNWWSCNSPIGYYMEHLPYVDRLWFGEAFDPDSPPDFWLIEMSGIPFGLSGDMLQNPNPWRGMIYGMTARAFYHGADPTEVWKLWDEFGIEDSEMIGYWDSSCPVRTNHEDVKATVYRKRDKSLIALASWAADPVSSRPAVDWSALGLDPQKVTLFAPRIRDFQEQASFHPGDAIPVAPGRGWLLIASESSGDK